MRALRSYFDEFIPARADDPAFTSLRGLSDVIAIEVRGDHGAEIFHLWFEDGRLRQGAPETGAPARTTFALDRATFEAIAAGELAPQTAFFDLRLTIRGDVLLGLQIGTLLAGFFRRHPWPAPQGR